MARKKKKIVMISAAFVGVGGLFVGQILKSLGVISFRDNILFLTVYMGLFSIWDWILVIKSLIKKESTEGLWEPLIGITALFFLFLWWLIVDWNTL